MRRSLVTAKKGGIANFFSSATGTKNSQSKVNAAKTDRGNQNLEDNDTDSKSEKKRNSNDQIETVEMSDLKPKATKSARKNVQTKIRTDKKQKKEEMEGKKRKRIKVFSDSEDSEDGKKWDS